MEATSDYEKGRLHRIRQSFESSKRKGMYHLQKAFQATTQEGNPYLHQINPTTIYQIRGWMLHAKHMTAPMAGNAMLTLSSAIKVGRIEGAIRVNPLNLVNWMVPKTERQRVITEEEWARLLEEVRKEGLALELRTSLAYYLGLRISEIFGLQVKDIKLEEGLLTSPTRKGSRHANKPPTRTLPIPKELEPILEKAIDSTRENISKDTLLFEALPRTIGQKGGQLQRSVYGWERARSRAGLNDVRFHDLRHTFATRMHERGAGTYDLMQALGHNHADSVTRYIHPDAERIRRFIK